MKRKPFPIYPEYLVREDGQVFSLKTNKVLKPRLDKGNYLRVQLTVRVNGEWKNKNVRVHRMVAITYKKNPHNKPQVNHDDGNKINNH